MPVALFDLDHTLLSGDSDYLWGLFLGERGIVDTETYVRENERFYREYREGRLDIYEFLRFSLAPLAAHSLEDLETWREGFVKEKIDPIVLPAGRRLIEEHRRQGDIPAIITATNAFVTRPIADRLGVEHLIATEPEFRDGHFTGAVAGIPCFREGKIRSLEQWLAEQGRDLDGSWFYSDSHNDLPLLERVDHPVAVDPDPLLREVARQRGWPVRSLRS